MKNIVKLLLLFSISLSAAAENQRETLVLEHLKLTGIQAHFENIEETFFNAMKNQFDIMQKEWISGYDENTSSEMTQIQDKYIKKLSSIASRHYSWEAMQTELIPIYLESFTDIELIEINKFFSSHYGKRYLEQSNFIESKLTEISSRKKEAWKPEMLALFDEMKVDLKKILDEHYKAQ